MSPGAALMGVGLLLPVVLEILEYFQKDPEADVSTALKNLQQQQIQELSQGEVFKGKSAEDKARRYQLPVEEGLRTSTMAGSGMLDAELGISGPRGGGSLLDAVSAEMGMNPAELRERYSPRRTGDLSDLTRAVIRS